MLDNLYFENVLSLGVDCRVRYQISRYFSDTRAVPPIVGGGNYSNTLIDMLKGTHLFDWNITWFADVTRSFEAGFQGLFDRLKLQPLANVPDVAVDGMYSFRYFHLFRPEPGMTFEMMIETQYDVVAPKVFYLRDKLVEHLKAENPTLYVRCQASQTEAERFCDTVRKCYPEHRFHLLIVDIQEETLGMTLKKADYSVYTMTRRVNKPPTAIWSGDDGEWSKLFDQICNTRRRLRAMT